MGAQPLAPDVRPALLLLALLLPLAAPQASAACDPSGQACVTEYDYGPEECEDGAAGGSMQVLARTAVSGHITYARWNQTRSCNPISETRGGSVESGFGAFLHTRAAWSSRTSDGWRDMRANATTPVGVGAAYWHGDATYCREDVVATLAGFGFHDGRPCPAPARPPPQPPAVPWGRILP